MESLPPSDVPPFDPELATVLASMASTKASLTSLDGIAAHRQRVDAMQLPMDKIIAGRPVEHTEHTISGHDGAPIKVSVFARSGHDRPGPGIYYMHGGGMITSNRFLFASDLVNWVDLHDAVAVTVEYRLAPEFKDPTPVEDSYAGLVWTEAHSAELGIDPTRILVAGTSAGGGLAAGVTLLARDRNGPAVSSQLLMCPMLDDRNSTVSSRQFVGVGVWDRVANGVGWSALLGDRQGGADVSVYAAPARSEDLGKLPPTYLDVGSCEVFRDEVVAYANKIWAAGGSAELHVWAGGFHGFDQIAPSAVLSSEARQTREGWVARQLSKR
jgi:acetyl esterase/lipase